MIHLKTDNNDDDDDYIDINPMHNVRSSKNFDKRNK